MSGTTHVTLLAAAQQFADLAEVYRQSTDLGSSYLGPELPETLERIAEAPEIRFFVDGTRNLGHQAATIALVERLVQKVHYNGHLRIVYADYANPYLGRTAEKLALLLPGLDPSRLDTAQLALGSSRVTFLPYDRRAELTRRVDFGFTGGADDMSVNYSKELNVRYFSRIQPYLWDDAPGQKNSPYYESSRIECIDGRHLYLVDSWPAFSSLVIKAAVEIPTGVAADTWEWYADRQRFDRALAMRVGNARTLFRALQRKRRARVWPVYGLHHFREATPDVTLNLIVAACRTQEVASGPLIVVSFTPEEETRDTHRVIAEFAADLKALASRYGRTRKVVGVRPPEAPRLSVSEGAQSGELYAELAPWVEGGGRLTVVTGYDNENGEYVDASRPIAAALKRAGPRDVVLIRLGTQPREVFNYWYGRADLPGIIEGQATASFLLSNGIPFLQIVREEQTFVNGYPTNLPGCDDTGMAERLNRFTVSLRDDRRRRSSGGPAANDRGIGADAPPGALALHEVTVAYEVGEYFRRVGRYCCQDLHDKFLIGLLALRAVLQTDETSVRRAVTREPRIARADSRDPS